MKNRLNQQFSLYLFPTPPVKKYNASHGYCWNAAFAAVNATLENKTPWDKWPRSWKMCDSIDDDAVGKI